MSPSHGTTARMPSCIAKSPPHRGHLNRRCDAPNICTIRMLWPRTAQTSRRTMRGCSGWSLMVFSFRSSRAPRCSRNPWQTTPQSSDAPCIVRSRTQLSPTEVAVEIRKTGRVARRFLPLLVHSQIKSPPRDYRHTTVRLYIAISRFAAYPQVRLVTGGQFGFGQHRRGENVHAT